ncbi:MAG: carbonic anhydrase [Mariprofundaceae bacterium]
MPTIEEMLRRNREWARRQKADDPEFFSRAAAGQHPSMLWIGCSDARVGPDKLVDLPMGTIFVHRNIANVFATNDLNCLAVLEYAVDVLRIPDIVVCGHYGCGGIRAALEHSGIQPIDLWTDQIRFVRQMHAAELDALESEARARRLAELNVLAQVHNIRRNTIVREAIKRGQNVRVYGLIYDIQDGILHRLGGD